MKKHVFSLLAACAVAMASPALAQSNSQPAAPAAANANAPHRVGLIDMAEVFQGYKKFEDLRNALQAEIEKSDAEAKVMIEKMQKVQAELNEQKFTPGSPQFEQAEKTLLQHKSDFEAFRAATQRKLARRESEMFKVIYADTTRAVALYADYAKYTVVMRFDRKDIDENTPPAEAVQRMNKQVVFHRPSDDITDVVLGYLNKEYAKTAPATGGQQAIRQTGASAVKQ